MIVVVGISHKTAPIAVREQAAMPDDTVREVLGQLVEQPEIGEALVVSTCNRVEVVASGTTNDGGRLESVANQVKSVVSNRVPVVTPHLYCYTGDRAVRHLFCVASSLDSLVLGEPQILGQVKAAFELARQQGTIGGHLDRAMSHAIRAAKRVRSETTVGAGQVSVPSVGVELARQIFGELTGRSAALIGSGEMGETAAKLIVAGGAKLEVVGRNRERVSALAEQMGATARSLTELDDTLVRADVIITATSAPNFVVTREAVAKARKGRRGRSLFLIDLAVPRDVDPTVDKLEGVFLYNVDDLSAIVADTLSSREREAEKALSIVDETARSYERTVSAEHVTPAIVALRRHLSDTLRAEMDKSLRGKLKHLSAEDGEAINRMMDSAVNKILHPASRHLRQLATPEADPGAKPLFAGVQEDALDDRIEFLKELFELKLEGGGTTTLSPAARKSLLPAKEDE